MELKNVVKSKDLKTLVIDKSKPLFDNHGFRLNRSQSCFKKEIDTAFITFNFSFYSYYPTHNEYSFYCYILLKELKPIITKFKNFCNEDPNILWNLLIVEGEFIYELLNKERKFQKIYTNEVDTIESIETATNQTLQIIEADVFSEVYANSTLSGFQEYFLKPERIMGRISEDDFVLSCLLASYLIDEQFYHDIIEFLVKELDNKKNEGKNFVSIYKLIDKVNAFVIHKNKAI